MDITVAASNIVRKLIAFTWTLITGHMIIEPIGTKPFDEEQLNMMLLVLSYNQ